jgi:two-component system CheB/CheR fusion protein
LEAFTQLLRALPTDTGMAFVLVQHLEPKHDSVLTTLLARATKMPVQEVREGMHVEANHVYVIPANADLSMLDGLLHIVGRKAPAGRHLPIDYFFRSLAETQGPRAVGVILSGTASDGTAGIRAVKEEGGITFAQDPESARFDGMPRSAIASGCVDFILPPERIAKELARIVRHPFVGLLPLDEIPALPALEEEWTRLFLFLRSATGVDFSLYKKSTVKRRLARRMAVCKADNLSAYLKILERNRAEVDALFAELLILVTSFFRDADVFVALQKKVFPKILADKPAGEPIRIWAAGCSTGQETYSIAICLLECLGDKAAARPIQIFSTDVSENAIEKARRGIYSEADVKEVSRERLRRFFTRVNGNYQVNQAIREMCVFARHDLARDPPFSKLDLLSCRNVLIYLEPALQKRILAAFHYGLRTHGALLLGKSESLGTYADMFSVTDRKYKFFRKSVGAHVPFSMAPPGYERVQVKSQKKVSPSVDLEKEVDRIVWKRYSHAGLLVNSDLQILHFRGDTSPYLRPTPGKASLQLMRILREELVLEVRAALQKARRGEKPVRSEGIEFRDNHHANEVNIEVRPLGRSGGDRCYLILFEQAPVRTAAQISRAPRGKDKKTANAEVLRLREDLSRSREYMQAVIRDQENTNEELKAANEEALSSMEELQSTNEELETAKEELQSSNEELVTLNEQLQNRNAELAQLSNDLSNVLSGVDIPIVILGSDRRIRRFTPPAEKLLGLIPGDVGRLISRLRIGVPIADLDDLISTVVKKGQDVIREVRTESGRWILLRVCPLRTGGEKIEGVLMSFVDIHELRQHQDALQKDKNFISAILDAAKDLLVVVLDPEARIVHFNQVCQRLTGYSLDDVRGRYVWDFLLDPEEVESVKATFREVVRGKPNQRENYWLTKDGRRLRISWSNSVARSDGEVESVIGTGIDVSERYDARQKAQQSEATVRALLETAAQAILACDKDGRVVVANASAEKIFGYDRDELIGRSIEALLPERLRAQHKVHRSNWFLEPRNRPMGVGLNLAGLRKDGSEFPVEVSLSYIGTNDGMLGVAFVSDITERKRSETTLRQYREDLQKLTGALLAAQESGNRELARELHDVFSQELVSCL